MFTMFAVRRIEQQMVKTSCVFYGFLLYRIKKNVSKTFVEDVMGIGHVFLETVYIAGHTIAKITFRIGYENYVICMKSLI